MMRKGKLSITWTYEPMPGGTKNIDVVLADPGCFQQISDAVVAAIKENCNKPINGLYNRYGYNKRQHNTPYYGTIKVTL
jgi:hypothetical protein